MTFSSYHYIFILGLSDDTDYCFRQYSILRGGVFKIKPGTLGTSLVEVSTHFHYNIVPVDDTTERTEVV